MSAIWCILENETAAFPVTVSETQTVAQLKKAIKAEKQITLAHVDANILALYRVNFDLSLDEECIGEAVKDFIQGLNDHEKLKHEKLKRELNEDEKLKHKN